MIRKLLFFFGKMSNTKWTRRRKLGEEGETVWLEGKMGGERLSSKWENNSPGRRRKRKENREPFLGWWLQRRRRKRRQFEFSCPHGAATAAATERKLTLVFS